MFVGICMTTLCLAQAGDSMFTLSEAHLKVLRKAAVLWSPVESGAPAVLISPQELDEEAEAGLIADVASRAGLSIGNPPTEAEKKQVKDLIAEMPEALAQLLAHGRLEAGTYSYQNPLLEIPIAANTLPPELAALGKQQVVSFAFTEQHAALLRHARWQGMWMNPKRPYGDMTYFELDMAEILGETVKRKPDGNLQPDQEERLQKLHAELLPALQVYLQKAILAPGPYPRVPL